jgi:radical SAM protein with 4Fe4S-binding SPASM domain
MRGIRAVLGVTLSAYNVGTFSQTFDACARVCPGLTIDDVHLNVAQVSGHYYGNDTGAQPITADRSSVRRELRAYRDLRGTARTPEQLLERTYLERLDEYLETSRTPMPCHALRASCFIDPWGVVYPCITYSNPIGKLRDTGMRIEPIWNAHQTRQVQGEIWQGQCPQCWTACEAYQSILGNVLAGRARRRGDTTPRTETASATAGPAR